MFFSIKKADCPVPPDIMAKFKHAHRAIQFFSSRWALSECLALMDITPPDSLLDLEVIDHGHLKTRPELIVSLSHTEDYGAAALAYQNQHRAIGIDIENKSRNIKDATKKLFVNDRDDDASLLELWCKKEAAFKAIYPLYQGDKALVLKDIWIQDNRFGLCQDHQLEGVVKIKESDHNLFCAIATL